MLKKDLKIALAKGMKLEEQALQKRFEQADATLLRNPSKKSRCVKENKAVTKTFTMPQDEFDLIEQIQTKILSIQHVATKSEIVRMGIKSLTSMSDTALLSLLNKIEKLKSGRPVKT